MRNNFLIISYSTKQYPFHDILASQVYHVRELHRLHEVWRLQTGNDTPGYKDNLYLRRLLQRLPDDALFYQVYHKWVACVLAPCYASQIGYSAHPKMRVHLAKTGCVSDFHCDTDVTNRSEQINCYLPFTDVFDSCTLWCETDYGAGDYQPLNLQYGQALLWDGGMLSHGTYANTTDHTRVSCDFRFHAKAPELVKSPWRDVLAGRP
jgi:hypothetical protein